MRVVPMLLTSLIFIFQSPPPIDGKKAQSSTQEKQRAADPTQEVFSKTIINNQECPREQKNESENKASERPPWWSETWSSWALVMVGIVAAWIAVHTLQDIRKQTIHLGNFAQATNRIAEATSNADRAWIEVTVGKPTTSIDQEGYTIGYNPEASEFGRYGIYITNHGRTVARVIDFKVWSGIFVKTTDIVLEKFNARFGNNIQMLLSANKPDFPIESFDFPNFFEKNQWDGVLNREVIATVRIDLRYEDIIRGEVSGKPHEPHRTTVIFGWDPQIEGLVSLARYNQYT